MASVNYPYPDPKTPAEREANRRTAEEYDSQEQEGHDFQLWQEELDQ